MLYFSYLTEVLMHHTRVLQKPVSFVLLLVVFCTSAFWYTTRAQAQTSDATLLQERLSELLLQASNLREELARTEGNVLLQHDLELGDAGIDVFILQQLLNKDPRTQVATEGPGAPGYETVFFGKATFNAVIRYQELFRDAILAPDGLRSGTGYVGARTRAHMNLRFEPYEDVPDSQETDPLSQVPDTSDTANAFVEPSSIDGPLPLNISPFRTTRGSAVTITGFGFTERENIVFLGTEHIIENIRSSSGRELTFEIPDTVEDGDYDIIIDNNLGTSGNTLFLVVDGDLGDIPTITSVSPNDGVFGDEVTIRGTGFTRTGNDIYTANGVIRNVSSPDGETLTFRFEPEDVEAEAGAGAPSGVNEEQSFVVVNENGISSRETTSSNTPAAKEGGDSSTAAESSSVDDDDSSFVWKALGAGALAVGAGILGGLFGSREDAGTPFGGRIISIDRCTCSGGLRLTIGPPKPAVILYLPGASKLYKYHNISEGNWTLGDYASGGVCLKRVVSTCIKLPVQGTIMKIGTSGGSRPSPL